MASKKYSSCSKCIEEALKIQEDPKYKDWEELGNALPQCKNCLDQLREKLLGLGKGEDGESKK